MEILRETQLRVAGLGALALLTCLLTGCSGDGAPAGAPGTDSTSTPSINPEEPGTSADAAPEAGATADAAPDATPSRPPYPVSLPALMQKQYDGRALRLGTELASTDAYRQYTVTYRSGRLKISGLLNVPRGEGPFPAAVLAHGYIDPAVYQNGQGMRREQDYLAREGYLTLHVDYRGHAGSSPAPRAQEKLRLGYTVDVINAVLALRRWDGPVDDDRIGLVGRSMGGGVVYNALAVRPGLVDAGVVFAPVSSDAVDNFERWTRPDSEVAQRIITEHGAPGKARKFWREVSPRTYFDRFAAPLMIHHGTSDDSCPIAWSRQTVKALRGQDKDVTFHVYEGEEHAFIPQWPLSMRRTVAFLDRHL